MRSGSGAFVEAGTITTGNGELHLSAWSPPPPSPFPPGQCRSAVTSRPGGAGSSPDRLPQPGPDAPVRRQRPAGGQHVEGEHRPERRRGPRHRRRRAPGSPGGDRAGDHRPGQVVSASNVDQILLHDQYVGETYTSDSTARTDELSTLASATLHALENRPFKLHTMADALSSAAQGRHVLLWSADTHTEAAWSGAGVAGAAPAVVADGRHHQPGREQAGPVSLARTSPSSSRPSGTTDGGDPDHDLLEHDAPGTVPVHRRPVPGPRHEYGEYVGIATVNLPGYARDITSPSNSSVVASGPGGPHHPGGCQPRHPPGCDAEHHLQLRAARGARLHDRRAERPDRARQLARRGARPERRPSRTTSPHHHLVAVPAPDTGLARAAGLVSPGRR